MYFDMAGEKCTYTKVIEIKLVEWKEVMKNFVYLAKEFKLYPENSGKPWKVFISVD